MNRKNFRTTARLLLTCICTLFFICPVWADTSEAADGDTTSAASRIITVGEDSSDNTDDADNVELVSPSGVSNDTMGTRGDSLGMFVTTGYCNCEKCSGGFHLTYSGTVPTANHTISADLDLFPIGTRLMINDVIYTVEDMGSNVNDNKLDIYYGSHAEAIAHGRKTVEVFAVVD